MGNRPDGPFFGIVDGDNLSEPGQGEYMVDKMRKGEDPEVASRCFYGLCSLENDSEPGTGDVFCG